MTLTIDLPAQVEQAYLAEAQSRGVDLAEVLRDVLVAARPSGESSELSPEDWIRQFRDWGRSHAGRNLPVLSDEAVSRESIYSGRGD